MHSGSDIQLNMGSDFYNKVGSSDSSSILGGANYNSILENFIRKKSIFHR